MTVTYRRLPLHPLLGRHVRHDSRSRAYPFDTSGLSIVSAKHQRRIPVLDQGNYLDPKTGKRISLGSCTGNAGIGALGTDPFYATVPRAGYPLDENGAVTLYSAATMIDDYPGQYPPTDTGSDGLSVAKVLAGSGEIADYRHTFTLDDALKALTVTPWITGTVWKQDMFTPDPDGRVHPTGAVAGGHEYVADEIDAEREQVWFTNSWGAGWGVVRDWPGRFWMSFADFGSLLDQQGDVTVFTPLPAPAPTPPPAPADPADAALAVVARPWIARKHTSIAGNGKMQAALKAWLTMKGL